MILVFLNLETFILKNYQPNINVDCIIYCIYEKIYEYKKKFFYTSF